MPDGEDRFAPTFREWLELNQTLTDLVTRQTNVIAAIATHEAEWRQFLREEHAPLVRDLQRRQGRMALWFAAATVIGSLSAALTILLALKVVGS